MGAMVGFCSAVAMEREDTDGVEKGRMLREFRQFILRGNRGRRQARLLVARLHDQREPADIPVGARRCAFCTSALAAVA
jgi:hypothetical protein